MVDYKSYEIIKEYSEKRYRISIDELYFINIVTEFFPLEELMASDVDAVSRFNKIIGEMYYAYLDSSYTSHEIYLSPLYADPDGFRMLCLKETNFDAEAWQECIYKICHSEDPLFPVIDKCYHDYIKKHRNVKQQEISSSLADYEVVDCYPADNGECYCEYRNSEGKGLIMNDRGRVLDDSGISLNDFLYREGIIIF